MKWFINFTSRIPNILLPLIIIWLFSCFEYAFGYGKITGFVYDEKSNKPLTGANVLIQGTQLGAATSKSGQFEIRNVPYGIYVIQASFIGYKTQLKENITIKNQTSIELIFKLIEEPIELRELVVTPGHFSISRSTMGTRQILTRENLQNVALYGGDVFRAITRLPGVTGNDFSSKFAIRGGRNEEVLVLFDGLEIYEPFHLKDIGGGVMSIIDMEAIGSIDLLTGGFTVEYGDKMSGVFNIHSTTTTTGQNRTSLGISLMNARIFTERHFKGKKGKLLLSARRGYIDALLKMTGNDKDFLPEYYDLFGTVQYHLSDNHSLSAHFLHAGDKLEFIDDSDAETDTGYGNTYAWLKFKSFFTQHLFAQSVLSIGKVDQNRNATVLTEDKIIQETVSDPRDFTFYGFKQDWSLELSKRHFLKWGFDVKKVKADYKYSNLSWESRAYGPEGEIKTISDTNQVNINPTGHELGIYLSERMRIFSAFTAEVGIRYDYHSYTNEKKWSPRINAAYSISSRTAIKAGWGHFYQTQGIHELEVQDNNKDFFPAELAEHRVIGLEHVFGNDIEFRIEVYQKKLSHIRQRYSNLIGTIDLFPELSGDRIREQPERGEAKGIEIYFKQDKGEKYSWWASYSLTSVDEWLVFRDVPRVFDQRHTFDLNFNYKPNKNWRFNIAWLYHSGWPYTKMLLGEKRAEGGLETVTVYFLEPEPLRESRLPDYHRLDLRLSRFFNISKGTLQVFVEITNAYNRSNMKNFDYTIVEAPDGTATLERIEHNWLPILPSVGITWQL